MPVSAYRWRAGAFVFLQSVGAYPVVGWLFPDDRSLRIESATDAAAFLVIALLCPTLAGWEIGGDWHDHATADDRKSSEAERGGAHER